MRFNKIIFLCFLMSTQSIFTQSYTSKFIEPICPDYKKSGSLEEASALGMLLTLGLSTAGSFDCAFYYDPSAGTYPSDCKELNCRMKNQSVILNNANHVRNISQEVINSKNTSPALRKKIEQGLIKIDKTIVKWKKVPKDTQFNYSNVEFIEKNLNSPLEGIIFKQLEILPNQVVEKYFKQEAEKQRIAAEKERQRIAAKQEKLRIEEEKRQKEIQLRKEEERKSTFYVSLSFVAIMIFWIYMARKSEDAKLRAEKLKAEEEKKLANEKKEIERQKIIKKMNGYIDKYKKIYEDKLNIYKNDFAKLSERILLEEEELLKLKSRHPKIESIVSSRKIGDSNSNIIKDIKNLLSKL